MEQFELNILEILKKYKLVIKPESKARVNLATDDGSIFGSGVYFRDALHQVMEHEIETKIKQLDK